MIEWFAFDLELESLFVALMATIGSNYSPKLFIFCDLILLAYNI